MLDLALLTDADWMPYAAEDAGRNQIVMLGAAD
jgi:hypothetical protein